MSLLKVKHSPTEFYSIINTSIMLNTLKLNNWRLRHVYIFIYVLQFLPPIVPFFPNDFLFLGASQSQPPLMEETLPARPLINELMMANLWKWSERENGQALRMIWFSSKTWSLNKLDLFLSVSKKESIGKVHQEGHIIHTKSEQSKRRSKSTKSTTYQMLASAFWRGLGPGSFTSAAPSTTRVVSFQLLHIVGKGGPHRGGEPHQNRKTSEPEITNLQQGRQRIFWDPLMTFPFSSQF